MVGNGKLRSSAWQPGKVWRWLTEPAEAVREPELRRQARLLSSLLVPIIPLPLLVFILRMVIDPAFVPSPVAVGGFAALAVAYGLSRSSHYRWGAVLSMGTFPVTIFAIAVTNYTPGDFASLLAYLTLGVLLSGVLLSVRSAVILAVVDAGGILLLPLLIPQVSFQTIVPPLTFLTLTSVAVVVTTHHRDLLEVDRRAELAESEERYRQAVESSPNPIFSVGREGEILTWNRACEEAFQYGRDIIGQHYRCLLANPEDLPALEAMTAQVFQKRALRDVDVPYRCKDGTERFMVSRLYPLLDEQGEVQACVFANTDLTERARAEEVAREQRTLAEALADTASALNSTLDPNEVLDRILDNIERVVPHDAATVMLIEEGEPGTACVVRARGYAERGLGEQVMRVRFPLDQTPNLCRMVTSGQPLAIPDTRLYSSWVDIPEARWIRSYAGAPIRLEGEVVGFLNLDSATPGFFTPDHAERLQAFADQAAVAIQNARLYEQAQHTAAQLEALRQVTLGITAELDLDMLLNALVESAVKLLDAQAGGVYLYRPERDVLERAVTIGPGEPPIGVEMKRGEGLSGKVWESGEPLMVDNYARWAGRSPLLNSHPPRAVLAVPIRWGGEFLGVINADADVPRTFSKEDARLLSLFADQAAVAIQNARLYQELEAYSKFLEQAVEERTEELRREKEQAEAILRSAADAVFITDIEGRIMSVNPAFEQQTGYRADEAIGQHTHMLGGPALSDQVVQEMINAVKSGHPWRGEIIVRRKDGSEYDADVNMAPLRQDRSELRGYVCAIRDISAQKEVERMKDAFVSNVSHELRTPITGLKLFLGLLRTAPPEKRDTILSSLVRETDRLNRIIEDLLRLSRLDQDRVEINLKPVDLNALAEQYVADRAPLAESRGLSLALERSAGLPPVRADEGLLGQALSVLLTNALNYTPQGGRVVIGTQARELDGQQWAWLSVTDTGPGIPPDEQKQLFQRFFRGKVGRESGTPGTGLGLAIAKEIIERHNGRIEVESQEGAGSTFKLALPIAEL